MSALAELSTGVSKLQQLLSKAGPLLSMFGGVKIADLEPSSLTALVAQSGLPINWTDDISARALEIAKSIDDEATVRSMVENHSITFIHHLLEGKTKSTGYTQCPHCTAHFLF